MPWPVYSERFMIAAGDGVNTIYTVPAGKRAIVRSVTAATEAVATARFYVYIANIVVWVHTFQAAYSAVSVDTHQVVYAGEQLKVLSQAVDLHVALSGYLLDDPSMATQAPGEVTRELERAPSALPSAA